MTTAKTTWKQALRSGVRSGTTAALASAATLMLCGWLENRRPVGPINGPSQWLWGEPAAHRTNATLRHTAAGYLIHHATSIFWATLYERFQPRTTAGNKSIRGITATGLGAAALAALVDYQLTPPRLQPGFDKQLSRRSLVAVYAAFGLGLAALRVLARHRERHTPLLKNAG